MASKLEAGKLTEFNKTHLIRKVRHDKPQKAAQDTKSARDLSLSHLSSLSLSEIPLQKLLEC